VRRKGRASGFQQLLAIALGIRARLSERGGIGAQKYLL
jgi:hypothetical protein